MSLRARLSLIVGVVLTVIMMIVGVFVVQTTRAALRDQVDAQVLETAVKIKPAYEREAEAGFADAASLIDPDIGTPAVSTPAAESRPAQFRAVARFVYSPDGDILVSQPSGFTDEPDPPPRLPRIPSEALFNALGQISTVSAEGSSLNYRMLVQRDDNDNFVITAAPLENAEEAVDRLVRTMALGSLAGIALAALVSWAMISRELRPVDRMIDTAAAIGEGDLGQRVPEPTEGTELGRLGRALNRMLGRIQASSEAQARSESRLRQFVADAAHELRTPLTSVRGYAELYRQGALESPDRVRKAMRRIEGEGARMGKLLDEMLLLARLDEQVEHTHEAVNFSMIVEDAVDALQAIQPDRSVDIDIADEVMVDGVALHLRQVVDNVLTNVRMHTPTDASVSVTLSAHGNRAELRIHDEGPGIDQAFIPQIFERFTKEDTARTRSTGGSGLGLAIATSLVEAHGGTIDVESEPGAGATFIVYLPLIDESASMNSST